MRLPEFQHNKVTATAAIDAYVELVAADHNRFQDPVLDTPETVAEVSVQLGKLCVAASSGGIPGVNRAYIASGAHELRERLFTKQADPNPTTSRWSYQQLLHTAEALTETAVHTPIGLRAVIHGSTVRSLEAALLAFRKVGKSANPGSIRLRDAAHNALAHYATLGLITRLHHPQLFAIGGLPHQTSGTYDAYSRFDICLTEANISDPDNSLTTQVHRISTAPGCFGQCASGRPTKALDNSRMRHRPDIALVSGCCDSGLRCSASDGSINPQLAHKLIAEYHNVLPADTTALLDDRSNAVLRAATFDQGRTGVNRSPRLGRAQLVSAQIGSPKHFRPASEGALAAMRRVAGLDGTAS